MLDVCPQHISEEFRRWITNEMSHITRIRITWQNVCSTASGHQQLASSSGRRSLPDCIGQNRGDERICEPQDCQLGGRGRWELAETGVVPQSMGTRVAQPRRNRASRRQGPSVARVGPLVQQGPAWHHP